MNILMFLLFCFQLSIACGFDERFFEIPPAPRCDASETSNITQKTMNIFKIKNPERVKATKCWNVIETIHQYFYFFFNNEPKIVNQHNVSVSLEDCKTELENAIEVSPNIWKSKKKIYDNVEKPLFYGEHIYTITEKWREDGTIETSDGIDVISGMESMDDCSFLNEFCKTKNVTIFWNIPPEEFGILARKAYEMMLSMVAPSFKFEPMIRKLFNKSEISEIPRFRTNPIQNTDVLQEIKFWNVSQDCLNMRQALYKNERNHELGPQLIVLKCIRIAQYQQREIKRLNRKKRLSFKEKMFQTEVETASESLFDNLLNEEFGKVEIDFNENAGPFFPNFDENRIKNVRNTTKFMEEYDEIARYELMDIVKTPGPIASSCLARIRLAASFDPNISTQINRYLDSMRFDKLRSFVCEKTAYFCDEQQQHEVGEIFKNHQKSMEIVENVRSQFSSTEKDQLNMMENLNDSLAEQAFYVYKFHQLPPLTLAILTATKSTLTTALTQNQPDPNLSRAMGTFSPADLLSLQNMSPADFPEEIRGHLAKCHITSHDVLQDTISFLLALRNSKMGSYSNSK